MEARSPEVDRFPESSPSQGHFAIELGVGYPYGGAYLKPLLLHWQAGITYDQITLDEVQHWRKGLGVLVPGQHGDGQLDHGVERLAEEAAARFGGDPRNYLVTVKRLTGDAQGQVSALVIVDIEWRKNERGQLVPTEIPGTERTLPAQLVLLAMGFVHPVQDGMLKSLGVALDPRGNVNANVMNYKTSVEKVFAGGDMRRGQSLVVWAIREGRQAASAVDDYLMGHSILPR